MFAPRQEPGFGAVTRAMWIGVSVNTLVPSATIGGEVVKARLLMLSGVPSAAAGASVVADKTVQAFTIVLWALLGIALLVWFTSGREIVPAALAGATVFALGVGGFVLVQHAGAFAFLASAASLFGSPEQAAWSRTKGAQLDSSLREIYRRPKRILFACLARIAAGLVLAAEIWLAAWIMGHPISIADAVMLRSISLALRGIAFVVPNGLGIQEGAFVVIGGLVGLATDFMLAVSLATRVRELIVSLPGLFIWQRAEGRALRR